MDDVVINFRVYSAAVVIVLEDLGHPMAVLNVNMVGVEEPMLITYIKVQVSLFKGTGSDFVTMSKE